MMGFFVPGQTRPVYHVTLSIKFLDEWKETKESLGWTLYVEFSDELMEIKEFRLNLVWSFRINELMKESLWLTLYMEL